MYTIDERIKLGENEDKIIDDKTIEAVKWLVSEKCRLAVNMAEFIEDSRNKKTGDVHKTLERSLGNPYKIMTVALQTGDLAIVTKGYREERLSAYKRDLKTEKILIDLNAEIGYKPGATLREVIDGLINRVFERVDGGERSGKLGNGAVNPLYSIELKGSFKEIEGNLRDANAAVDGKRKGEPLPASGLVAEIERAKNNDKLITILIMHVVDDVERMNRIYSNIDYIRSSLGAKTNVLCAFCHKETLLYAVRKIFATMARITGRNYYSEKDIGYCELTPEEIANVPVTIKNLPTYRRCGGVLQSMGDWDRLKEEYVMTFDDRQMGEYFAYLDVSVSDEDVIF